MKSFKDNKIGKNYDLQGLLRVREDGISVLTSHANDGSEIRLVPHTHASFSDCFVLLLSQNLLHGYYFYVLILTHFNVFLFVLSIC